MIWLLRHGDAEDGFPDSERPLSEDGQQQARAAGQALARLGAQPKTCLSSPKLRARDTALLACAVLGVDVELEEELIGGPFDPGALAAGRGDTLLVGHEPSLSQAVLEATGARVEMKKGGVAGIDRGRLRLLLGPRELRAITGDE